MQSDSKIDLDARFMTKNDSKQCGAKVINFKDIKEKSEKAKDHDEKAKKMILVTGLFNEFSKKH